MEISCHGTFFRSARHCDPSQAAHRLLYRPGAAAVAAVLTAEPSGGAASGGACAEEHGKSRPVEILPGSGGLTGQLGPRPLARVSAALAVPSSAWHTLRQGPAEAQGPAPRAPTSPQGEPPVSSIKTSVSTSTAPAPHSEAGAAPPLTPLRSTAVGVISALADLSLGHPISAIKGWQQNGHSGLQELYRPWQTQRPRSALATNLRGLYAGFMPMYLGHGSSIGWIFLQQPVYRGMLRRAGLDDGPADAGAWLASASVTALAWTAPLEGVMVKLQHAHQQGTPLSLAGAVQRARADGGLTSLWRGATPQSVRTLGFVVSVGAADALRGHLADSAWGQASPQLASVAASSVCGLAGAVVTNPADVLKTRMQQFDGPRCLAQAAAELRAQGPRVAMRGLSARAVGFVWGAEIYARALATLTPLFQEQAADSAV